MLVGSHGRAVLAAYRDLGPSVWLHTGIRWLTSPMAALSVLVPGTGTVLDLGCGHALLSLQLARAHPHLRVHAVDLDEAKVRHARRALRTAAAASVADRIEVEVVDRSWAPAAECYDAVIIADVLYLLGRAEAIDFLTVACRAVRPGGTIVVKEMGDRPRWKRTVAAVQEQLAVRFLRITSGQHVAILSEAEIAGTMSSECTEVRRRDLGQGYPHPHVAWVGTRSSPM